jgi:nucleotide-binding universal stress UspA family protein
VTFARILVPLDGSRLAEAVLPAASSLASALGASLVLLHVLEQEPPAQVHGEPHLDSVEEAGAYLERLADELRGRGVSVETNVHERPVDDVATAIDAHTHELNADLIAMCAHGHTNLLTRLLGSIAERILRGGSVPILLRTVREPSSAEFALRQLLVPVDFTHDVESALSAARVLAPPYDATVTLLAAVEPPAPATARFLGGAFAVSRAYDAEDLRERLDVLADELRADIPRVRPVVADESPTDAIVEVSSSLPADLIVLVTDAHAGVSTWLDPSTGQELLRRPDLTLLLIKEL